LHQDQQKISEKIGTLKKKVKKNLDS